MPMEGAWKAPGRKAGRNASETLWRAFGDPCRGCYGKPLGGLLEGHRTCTGTRPEGASEGRDKFVEGRWSDTLEDPQEARLERPRASTGAFQERFWKCSWKPLWKALGRR